MLSNTLWYTYWNMKEPYRSWKTWKHIEHTSRSFHKGRKDIFSLELGIAILKNKDRDATLHQWPTASLHQLMACLLSAKPLPEPALIFRVSQLNFFYKLTEIWITMCIFSFQQMHSKMPCTKCQPFRSGLEVSTLPLCGEWKISERSGVGITKPLFSVHIHIWQVSPLRWHLPNVNVSEMI